MSWDTTSTTTGSNLVFSTVMYNTSSATTDTTVSCFYSAGYVGTGDFHGTAGGFYNTGITSCGNGWNGQSRRGFAAHDIRLVRCDFDSVKTDRKRKRAELKARRLFKRVVGDTRYQRFRERGFHEIVGKSGTRYRLAPGQWVKVMEEDEKSSEKVKHLLCAHLPFGVPWFDTMAVQHLMLASSKETEDRFLGLANVHSVEGPYPIPELEVAA